MRGSAKVIDLHMADRQINSIPLARLGEELNDLVSRVALGNEVSLTKGGRVIARLVKVGEKNKKAVVGKAKRTTAARPRSLAAAKLRLAAVRRLLAINKGNKLGSLSAKDLVREGRKW